MRQRPTDARVAVRCIASASYVGMCPHCTGMFVPGLASGLRAALKRQLLAGAARLPAAAVRRILGGLSNLRKRRGKRPRTDPTAGRRS